MVRLRLTREWAVGTASPHVRSTFSRAGCAGTARKSLRGNEHFGVFAVRIGERLEPLLDDVIEIDCRRHERVSVDVTGGERLDDRVELATKR